MAGTFDILSVDNIVSITDELQDVRTLPGNFLWTKRIPIIPALDDEIMARYTGRVMAADIVADDEAAVVRAANPIRLQQTKIPNLKHGEQITQAMLSVLQRIQAGNASRRDNNIFEDYLVRRVQDLVIGVYSRMEALMVAMMIDAFTYNRLGIIISNGSWGMPSDLKVTSSPVWSGTTGKPITDILTLKRIAAQKYGIILDRITMSTQALLYAAATTEFQVMAAPFMVALGIAATTLNVQNVNRMAELGSSVTGMTWEVYDWQAWTEAPDGTITAAPYLPANKVILSSKAADGNADVMDFANGVVFETMMGMVPTMIGEYPSEREGPVGYATAGSPHGNPPGQILWGVARGFPRRHKEAASAVITAY